MYEEHTQINGLSGNSASKEFTCNVGDLGRSPGKGNSFPLQYSGLENSMDRGAWQVTGHGVKESHTTEQLSLSQISKWKKKSNR